MWTIIQGDCVEVMAGMKAGSVRLLFADPPYNIGVHYDVHNDRQSHAAYAAWSERWVQAATRLLSPDGSLWVLLNHEQSPYVRLLAEAAGLHHRQTIIWFESFGVNTTRKFNRCTRPLLWMTRHPRQFVFNADAVRTRSARQASYNDKRADPRGKILDDLWQIPRVCGTHCERVDGFPTQLPVELLRRVVGCASEPGDLVLDPFCGSGTTGAACLELGRKFVGIELSPKYAELARRRLSGITALPLVVG
jgi:site-specific DNA-methyltransferase (adenine-specific)